ncbi:hypothetical protein OPQ81_002947 [Rhizoctonia solani]|nr:hypothetical protein OPQ81_002947 [Rhizoctonia solani]
MQAPRSKCAYIQASSGLSTPPRKKTYLLGRDMSRKSLRRRLLLLRWPHALRLFLLFRPKQPLLLLKLLQMILPYELFRKDRPYQASRLSSVE